MSAHSVFPTSPSSARDDVFSSAAIDLNISGVFRHLSFKESLVAVLGAYFKREGKIGDSPDLLVSFQVMVSARIIPPSMGLYCGYPPRSEGESTFPTAPEIS